MASNVVDLSWDDAMAICIRAEGDFFDRKAIGISPKKTQKAAVAFSNADGGEFVVGIADDKHEPDPEKRWSGAQNVEYFNDTLHALFSLNPSIDFRHEFLTTSKLTGVVLRVYVSRSSSVCKTDDKTVYQRQGASSVPLSDPEKITALAFAKGASSFEDYLLDVDPELVVDSSEATRFCSQLSPPQASLTYCSNEALIDRKTFAPTCAGVLLFAESPQPIFPRRCATKVVFYDTKQETPERDHLKRNITIEGCIYSQFHGILKEITSIMSGISVMTAHGLKKIEYPPEAIWEVVANAMIHRDYSIADDIQISIFQNRIEVKSPGRLPGFVTEQNYLDVRYSRNPKIVRSLARYQNPINKDLGEGLNTAFEKMRAWKLQSPQLREQGNYVIVTLPHTPLASPEEGIIEYLNSHDEIKNGVAREITGIRSENQMKEVFYRLRDKNLIERVPGKRGNAAAWRKISAADSSSATTGSTPASD
jgi:ATP-dependent DNA helicase RecG